MDPHGSARAYAIDDDAGAVHRGISLAERGDHAVTASLGRAEVNEQHLVFPVVDDLRQEVPAARQVRCRELALEDRVLQVVAEPAHGLVDLREPAVVADVVADQVRVPHLSCIGRSRQTLRVRPHAKARPPAATGLIVALSGRNRLRGFVEEVRIDGILGQVRLRIGDQLLTAVITADAIHELKLKRGDDAIAIVKSTEVMIAREGVVPEPAMARPRRRP
jgi:molybdopterin-binding protein